MDERPRIIGRDGDLEILDNAAERRYEARRDGELAGVIDYTPHEGWLSLDHTGVEAAFEGRGVGARLVTAALDDIRTRSMFLAPRCPYVAAFIRKHREYGGLVVGARGPRGREPG